VVRAAPWDHRVHLHMAQPEDHGLGQVPDRKRAREMHVPETRVQICSGRRGASCPDHTVEQASCGHHRQCWAWEVQVNCDRPPQCWALAVLVNKGVVRTVLQVLQAQEAQEAQLDGAACFAAAQLRSWQSGQS
jgi:hypothetical protein